MAAWKTKEDLRRVPMNVSKLATFAFALASIMHAQSFTTLTANIPFKFDVSGKTLPAGEYTVTQVSSGGAVVVSRADNKASALAIAQSPMAPAGSQETARLVFHRYGNRCFLFQFWTPGGYRRQLPPTNLELECERQDTPHPHAG